MGLVADREQKEYTGNDLLIGTVYALIAAIPGAFIYILIKRMKDMHFTYSPFWFSMGCLVWAPFSQIFFNSTVPSLFGIP